MRYMCKLDIDKICNYVELYLLIYYMSRCIEIVKFLNDLLKISFFFINIGYIFKFFFFW